jgi:hypothetical protein
LVAASVVPVSQVVAQRNGPDGAATPQAAEPIAARMLAIFAHLAVLGGLVMMGRRHFHDPDLGLAMATLYLLLPCTAYNVHQVNHVLPAAFVLWAGVAYRRPVVAGGLMALACGTLFFPIFLLPLWLGFYGRRGGARFAVGLGCVAALLMGTFALTSADGNSFTQQTLEAIDWSLLSFGGNAATGFWNAANEAYRIPVFVAFLLATFVLTVWPRQKNLEHLLAHSAAIVVATQFWYPRQTGAFVLWYLPLVLLVAYRPRLDALRPPEFESQRRTENEPARPVAATIAGAASRGRTALR